MKDIVRLIPADVYSKFEQLPQEKKEKFLYHFSQKAKSPEMAFWACILFGWHYIYLGEIGKQILFWFTGGGLLIWALVDLFSIKKKVQEHNRSAALEALQLV